MASGFTASKDEVMDKQVKKDGQVVESESKWDALPHPADDQLSP